MFTKTSSPLSPTSTAPPVTVDIPITQTSTPVVLKAKPSPEPSPRATATAATFSSSPTAKATAATFAAASLPSSPLPKQPHPPPSAAPVGKRLMAKVAARLVSSQEKDGGVGGGGVGIAARLLAGAPPAVRQKMMRQSYDRFLENHFGLEHSHSAKPAATTQYGESRMPMFASRTVSPASIANRQCFSC